MIIKLTLLDDSLLDACMPMVIMRTFRVVRRAKRKIMSLLVQSEPRIRGRPSIG